MSTLVLFLAVVISEFRGFFAVSVYLFTSSCFASPFNIYDINCAHCIKDFDWLA